MRWPSRNRPVGSPVTVTATVTDFNKVGLALGRDGVAEPVADADLLRTASRRTARAPQTAPDLNGDTSWRCWRKVWLVRKMPGAQAGCTDITHTATGGGVRTGVAINSIRAQIPRRQGPFELPVPVRGPLRLSAAVTGVHRHQQQPSHASRNLDAAPPPPPAESRPSLPPHRLSPAQEDSMAGRGASPVFEGEQATLSIDLGRTLKAGETAELSLAFHRRDDRRRLHAVASRRPQPPA